MLSLLGKLSSESTKKSDQHNVSKDIMLESKGDQEFYDDVCKPDNPKLLLSQYQKEIKTTRNVVYGISDSQNPNEINMQPNQVYDIRSQNEAGNDAAESNKHFHDKTKKTNTQQNKSSPPSEYDYI